MCYNDGDDVLILVNCGIGKINRTETMSAFSETRLLRLQKKNLKFVKDVNVDVQKKIFTFNEFLETESSENKDSVKKVETMLLN